MALPTDVRIVDVASHAEAIAFRVPIKFGGRVMQAMTVFDVEVTLETRAGQRATGHGSMPLGNVWAWPSQTVSADQSHAAMLELAQRLARQAADFQEYGHPLQLTIGLSHGHAAAADEVVRQLELREPMPRLAQLVCASPLEAALHDGYGRALGANSYDVLGPEYIAEDLGTFLNGDFSGEFLDRYTLRTPKPRMPLYHLVGALDPLTDADLSARVDDGLPETLGEWIEAEGLTHLKIKLNGDDLAWDVERVLGVERVAAEVQARTSGSPWHYSLDFNEKCGSVEYVLEFLAQVQKKSPAAFQRVQYIEQPTHRDLKAHADLKMHAAAKIKPVVIDESLIDLESLLLARELGYSGVALKACKGQTEALLMGAAAQKYGLFLCVQDLTCPGASFLHSASLAARVPTVAAIEGNARQFCPSGNAGWNQRFPGMFKITDGTLDTSLLNGPGLGF